MNGSRGSDDCVVVVVADVRLLSSDAVRVCKGSSVAMLRTRSRGEREREMERKRHDE